jgi:hypothetical protein
MQAISYITLHASLPEEDGLTPAVAAIDLPARER